eukprot:1180272-Prorocentrum_minimum.AAC.1
MAAWSPNGGGVGRAGAPFFLRPFLLQQDVAHAQQTAVHRTQSGPPRSAPLSQLDPGDTRETRNLP